MKIIDFHTHIFPDNVAGHAVSCIENLSGFKACAAADAESLRKVMKEDGIALSLNAPVATKPEQVVSINRKMAEFNSAGNFPEIICLGSMHPLFGRHGNIREEAEFLAKAGIKGIKMHTEYQSFYPDDGTMKVIYEACAANNLFILFHAGVDLAYDADDVKGIPSRFKAVLDIKGLTIVLAHMGGYRLWDEVYRHLCGSRAYFDTAFTAEMDDSGFSSLINNHGADRVLFGSDFPWEGPRIIADKIRRSITDENSLKSIFCGNAEKLLRINTGC